MALKASIEKSSLWLKWEMEQTLLFQKSLKEKLLRWDRSSFSFKRRRSSQHIFLSPSYISSPALCWRCEKDFHKECEQKTGTFIPLEKRRLSLQCKKSSVIVPLKLKEQHQEEVTGNRVKPSGHRATPVTRPEANGFILEWSHFRDYVECTSLGRSHFTEHLLMKNEVLSSQSPQYPEGGVC